VDESGGVLIQSVRGSGYWLRTPERADMNAADMNAMA